MPAHDWSRVDDGDFRSFHNSWISGLVIHLKRILPAGYYAQSERIARLGRERVEPDVLALRHPHDQPDPNGGVALATAPPVVESRTEFVPVSHRLPARRRVVLRSIRGDQIVAFIEIVSPGNKRRAAAVVDFVRKIREALRDGVHVLVLDLHRPRRHDPRGLHAEIIGEFTEVTELPPG